MALIKCPECEQMMSDKAITCPHCGSPNLLDLYYEGFTSKQAEMQNKLIVLKVLREMFGLDLRTASGMMNSYPSRVSEGIALKDAQRIKQILDSYSCCHRFEPSEATRQTPVDFRHV